MTTSEKTTPGAKRRRPLDGAGRALLDRRLLSYAAAPALILAAPAMASADFTGPYDVSNWQLTLNNSNGGVDTSGAPASITIIGPDTGDLNGIGGTTDFTIDAAGTGIWSFAWEYSSVDDDDFDGAGWLLNGVYTEVVNNETQGTGGESIPVVVGDIIGFRVRSFDNQLGPGIFTISDFEAPVDVIPPVPAPSTLALLALGAAGLGVVRQRRKAARTN